LFHQFVTEYGAKMKLGQHLWRRFDIRPFLFQEIDNCILNIRDESRFISTRRWSDVIICVFTAFMQNGGNINFYYDNLRSTILSHLIGCTINMTYDDTCPIFQCVNDASKFLLHHGADMGLGSVMHVSHYKLVKIVCSTYNIPMIKCFLHYHQQAKQEAIHKTWLAGYDERYRPTTIFSAFGYNNLCFRVITRLFLQAGFSINTKDHNGNTIIHTFLMYRGFSLVDFFTYLLDECMADFLSIRNNNGMTEC
jgi:hypothetical protein